MRAIIVIVAGIVLICSRPDARAQQVERSVEATARTPEDAARMVGSARYLYHQQVHTMLQAAVAPEFVRHHERSTVVP